MMVESSCRFSLILRGPFMAAQSANEFGTETELSHLAGGSRRLAVRRWWMRMQNEGASGDLMSGAWLPVCSSASVLAQK